MGYDPDRFVSVINDNMICAICEEVYEDPMECGVCETNFCSSCITLWQQKSALCPNRCELKLQKSHKFFRSMLESLLITCSNKVQGCSEIFKLESIKYHEEKECKYRRVNCKNEGCDAMFMYLDLELHENKCQMRIVSCLDCKSQFSAINSQEHKCIKSIAQILLTLKERSVEIENSIIPIQEKFSNAPLHFGAVCSGCKQSPIQNARYICLDCIDFSYCGNCYLKSNHVHNNFVKLNKPSYHESVTCDGCRVYPIPSIRFKCKECEDFGNF